MTGVRGVLDYAGCFAEAAVLTTVPLCLLVAMMRSAGVGLGWAQ